MNDAYRTPASVEPVSELSQALDRLEDLAGVLSQALELAEDSDIETIWDAVSEMIIHLARAHATSDLGHAGTILRNAADVVDTLQRLSVGDFEAEPPSEPET